MGEDSEDKLWFICTICDAAFEDGKWLLKHKSGAHGIWKKSGPALILSQAEMSPSIRLTRCKNTNQQLGPAKSGGFKIKNSSTSRRPWKHRAKILNRAALLPSVVLTRTRVGNDELYHRSESASIPSECYRLDMKIEGETIPSDSAHQLHGSEPTSTEVVTSQQQQYLAVSSSNILSEVKLETDSIILASPTTTHLHHLHLTEQPPGLEVDSCMPDFQNDQDMDTTHPETEIEISDVKSSLTFLTPLLSTGSRDEKAQNSGYLHSVESDADAESVPEVPIRKSLRFRGSAIVCPAANASDDIDDGSSEYEASDLGTSEDGASNLDIEDTKNDCADDEAKNGVQIADSGIKLDSESDEILMKIQDNVTVLKNPQIRRGVPRKLIKMKCQICQTERTSQDSMWKHFEKSHTVRINGKDPLECRICGKRFLDSWKLRRHGRTHANSYEKGINSDSDAIHLETETEIKISDVNASPSPTNSTFITMSDDKTQDSDSGNLNSNATVADTPIRQSLRLRGSPKVYAETNGSDDSDIEIEVENRKDDSSDSEVSERSAKNFDLESQSQDEILAKLKDNIIVLMANPSIKVKAGTVNNVFECKICAAQFQRCKSLWKHFQETHTADLDGAVDRGFGQNKIYTCKVCGRRFSFRHNLRRHGRVHSGQLDTDPLDCKICGRGFTSEYVLRGHTRRVHTNKDLKQFHCKHCDWKCWSATVLKSHERVHTGEQPYQCDICQRRFSLSQNMHNHKRNIHGVLTTRKNGGPRTVFRKVLCTVCGKEVRPDTIKQHMKSHTTAKPFKCSQCDHAFKGAGTLLVHVARVHSDARPVQCAECGSCYKLPGDLTRHSRVHNDPDRNAKRLECTICGRKFAKPEHLKYHEGTHDPSTVRQKKHECKICGHKFPFPHRLKKHVEKHHSGGNGDGALSEEGGS